jgi:hypothetical protein
MAAVLPANEERGERRLSADRVPTLTEVVELAGEPAPPVPPAPPAVLAAEPDTDEAPAAALPEPVPEPAPSPPDPQALAALVLAELAPRIDLLLEARLREALAPALARAADGLIRDSRYELNHALQDLVREAVARVLQQQGPG